MKLKRITAVLTAAAITFLPIIQISAEPRQDFQTEEKQYVLIMENAAAYEEAVEKIGDDIIEDTSDLSEKNVIVANLDNSEVKKLEQYDDILVEEDILLTASMLEGGCLDTAAEEAVPEIEWNLQAINLEEATEEESENHQKVKVAVLDSGVDYVTGINLKEQVNFIDGEEELSAIFQDFTGHGTGIAGVIAGNGENGIYGVNPNVDLYSVKVLDASNTSPLSRIIQGIYWCIENDINIINMSFGTSVYSRALEQAVKDAYQEGILMVGAAGNGSGAVEYPAAFSEVMAVTSVSPEAEISEFSNTGEELDIAAPGEKIRVAGFFDGSMVTHGTSIAVPHVTGAAALLWEKDMSKSNEFIRQLINYSAKSLKGTDECGLLDIEYAYELYDTFAESFDTVEAQLESEIPENVVKPESFDEVNVDEEYVEGRWSQGNHQAAVDKSGISFSASAIKLIKEGIVYPDKNPDWQGSAKEQHPRWHGKWVTKNDYKLNYVAVFDMLTRIAINGGTINFNSSDVPGMTASLYNNFAADMNGLQGKYTSLVGSNTKENRKYFLYGCAIHTITDAFAHSAVDVDSNKRISHDDGADNITFHPRRYEMAVQVTKLALQNLKNNAKSNGADVLKAIKSKYVDGTTKFKLINIKQYLNENGYNDAVLDKINVNRNIPN